MEREWRKIGIETWEVFIKRVKTSASGRSFEKPVNTMKTYYSVIGYSTLVCT